MSATANIPKHFSRSKPMTVRRVNKHLPNAQHATRNAMRPGFYHANTFAPKHLTALPDMKAKPHLTKKNLLRNSATRHLNI